MNAWPQKIRGGEGPRCPRTVEKGVGVEEGVGVDEGVGVEEGLGVGVGCTQQTEKEEEGKEGGSNNGPTVLLMG